MWRVTERHVYLGKVRVMVKRNESYLALVALLLSSVRLRATGRTVLASRGPCPVLELADAAARAAQRAGFSRVGPDLGDEA